MGCCLGVILLLSMPRLAMFLAWLLTDWFARAFQTHFWPLLGFFLMPYTTLAYMAAMLNNNHSVSGGWLVLLVVAVFVDLGAWGGGGKYHRQARRKHH